MRVSPVSHLTLARGHWSCLLALFGMLSAIEPIWAGPARKTTTLTSQQSSEGLDLSPEGLESSPVLQRWMEEIPEVWEDIAHDPSFRTRLRLGYVQFPDLDEAEGWKVAIEEVMLDLTGLTLSGDYQKTGNGEAWGLDFRYYLRPLGSYVNVAPVMGYRYFAIDGDSSEGAHVGMRLLWVLSRGGASEISLTQSWIAPSTSEEVSLTTLSLAYSLTQDIRLSTDIQQIDGEGRVGIFMEWMP